MSTPDPSFVTFPNECTEDFDLTKYLLDSFCRKTRVAEASEREETPLDCSKVLLLLRQASELKPAICTSGAFRSVQWELNRHCPLSVTVSEMLLQNGLKPCVCRLPAAVPQRLQRLQRSRRSAAGVVRGAAGASAATIEKTAYKVFMDLL